MRKPIIAGNWKLNKTPHEAIILVNELKREIVDVDGVGVAGHACKQHDVGLGDGLGKGGAHTDAQVFDVVPEEIAEEALALVQSVMRAPLDWWPELVLWSEGGIGDTYGEAK